MQTWSLVCVIITICLYILLQVCNYNVGILLSLKVVLGFNKPWLTFSSFKTTGLFNYDHMEYEADRNKTNEPSIAEMTEKAIQILSKNKKGFFLLVEGKFLDGRSIAAQVLSA